MIKIGNIEWEVIDTKQDLMLVMSKKPVAYMGLHNLDSDVNWKNCNLRKWLNKEFIKRFNADEIKRIVDTKVTIFPTGLYGDNKELYVKDKISLLDYDSVNKLFKYSVDLICKDEEDKACNWWILPIGATGEMSCYCDKMGRVFYKGTMRNKHGGSVSYSGDSDKTKKYAVRPIMWIKKQNASQYAKTIIVKEDKLSKNFIEIGYWTQERYGATTPIQWQILKKENNKLLLISRYGLSYTNFHDKLVPTNWNKSFLRKWLNSYFLSISGLDKEDVLETEVKTPKTKYSQINQGQSTKDKVFILSIDEAEKYFECDVDRICKPSPYLAKKHFESNDNWCGSTGWWLRNMGIFSETACFVGPYGNIAYYGDFNERCFSPQKVNENLCVRPAIWIKR